MLLMLKKNYYNDKITGERFKDPKFEYGTSSAAVMKMLEQMAQNGREIVIYSIAKPEEVADV